MVANPTTFRVPMRDGLSLVADLYLPAGAGPHPIIILRTPYGRRQMKPLGAAFAARGYGFLVQDVRGTGESEGSFGLYPQEPPDAVETARWLLDQPWCDGRLGILGLSYCSGAAIAIAAELPDQVKACIWVTAPISRDLLSWKGGALRLHHAAPWSLLLATGSPMKARDWQAFYRTLPLSAMAPNSPFWQMLSQNEEPTTPFWRGMDLSRYLDRVKAPGLHAGGWYDFLLDATLEPFQRISRAAGSPQRLLLGPWSHNAILSAPEFQHEAFAWLDRFFQGAEIRSAPATVYLTGEGSLAGWRNLGGWPEPTATPTRLYLASGGRLTPERPVEEGAASFLSDPEEPVPTQGGAVWEFPQAQVGLEPGPAIQTTGDRPDVLTYDTEPAVRPWAICGDIQLELWASTSTPDADFAVKLCDVAPDGVARYICDSIIRVRYRNGMERPEPLKPGEIIRLTISIPGGHAFGPGHRLRLEVAGSNFPKFDRNLHAGGSLMGTGPDQAIPSRQTILFGTSHLELPVLGTDV